MIQQHFFESQELPAKFKCQILSFMRAEWPQDFQGKNRLRKWIKQPEMHPVHFILEEEDILISHVAVVLETAAPCWSRVQSLRIYRGIYLSCLAEAGIWPPIDLSGERVY